MTVVLSLNEYIQTIVRTLRVVNKFVCETTVILVQKAYGRRRPDGEYVYNLHK